MPWSDTILEIYKFANWLAVIVSLTGRKWATFENWSMTTKIASLPFWDLGRPVTKSIWILSHFHSGIGSGCRSPAGFWCSALTRRQTSHSSIYRAMSCFILDHQYFWRMSRYILVLPGWIERGVSCASFITFSVISSNRGTTMRSLKYKVPSSPSEKSLDFSKARSFFIRSTWASLAWADLIAFRRVGSKTRLFREPCGTSWRFSLHSSS